jgi:hypothetical protein
MHEPDREDTREGRCKGGREQSGPGETACGEGAVEQVRTRESCACEGRVG